jgi:enoyl-CoA hydratase/carnithine racemase
MEILTDVRNKIAHLTLNRPAALNALSLTMVRELGQALKEFATDPQIRAILIRGAGDKAFCAGGDIRALYDSFKSGGSLHHDFFAEEYRLDYYLHKYPKPYVALIDGITMGGGMGIAQSSTLRIVGDRTRIAMPEVGIGLFPDVGGSYFLSRLPGALGIYLALTGNQIRAADALYAGLADRYLPPEAMLRLDAALDTLVWTDDGRGNLVRALDELTTSGATGSATAAAFGASPAHSAATATSTAASTPPLSSVRAAIDSHFSKATVSQIMDSLRGESRPEYTEWAAHTLKTMGTRSPTMMWVTLRQLQRGRALSLADCFRMELGITRQCFLQGDFIEGVRAVIVDKDNTPRWSPGRLEEVTEASVGAFFTNPLGRFV